jgi:hypothetical protein
MKPILFLLCFSLFSQLSVAQSWQPLNLSDKYNYKIGDSTIISRTLWVDSVKIENGNSVFYLNRTIIPCDTCQASYLYLKDQGMFLQETMRKHQNSYYFSGFRHFRTDPLAELNQSWPFDTLNSIQAEVVGQGPFIYFGIPDSLKTILLSSGDTIELSKSFGIIRFPDLDFGETYHLAGIEGRNLGELVPGFYDIFRFEPGDIFGYYNDESFFDGTLWNCQWSRFYREIIERTEIPNGFEYYFKGAGKYTDNHYCFLGPDTVYGTTEPWYSELSYLEEEFPVSNAYPGQIVYNPLASFYSTEPNTYAVVHLREFNNGDRLIKSLKRKNYVDEPGVFIALEPGSDFLYQIYNDADDIYGQGLGHIYWFIEYFEGGIWTELQAAYVQGDTLWGVPQLSSYLISSIEPSVKQKLRLFPNPNKGTFTIEGLRELNVQELLIFGQLGQPVSFEVVNQDGNMQTVRIYNPRTGLYLLKMKTLRREVLLKIVVF